MKNKKSQERAKLISLKVKTINKNIVRYLLIFILTVVVLMLLPKTEKIIVETLAFLLPTSVLNVLVKSYISVKKLGLGKTRKELESEINKSYFKNIFISLMLLIMLIIIDYHVYKNVEHYLIAFLYMMGLIIYTLPLNFLLNIRMNPIFKKLIMFLTFIVLCVIIYIYFYTKTFYISYIVSIVELIVLFLFRQKGYHKKDL